MNSFMKNATRSLLATIIALMVVQFCLHAKEYTFRNGTNETNILLADIALPFKSTEDSWELYLTSLKGKEITEEITEAIDQLSPCPPQMLSLQDNDSWTLKLLKNDELQVSLVFTKSEVKDDLNQKNQTNYTWEVIEEVEKLILKNTTKIVSLEIKEKPSN